MANSKKSARLKAKRRAKLRRGRQQQRQDPKVRSIRRNKRKMRVKKMRRGK